MAASRPTLVSSEVISMVKLPAQRVLIPGTKLISDEAVDELVSPLPRGSPRNSLIFFRPTEKIVMRMVKTLCDGVRNAGLRANI